MFFYLLLLVFIIVNRFECKNNIVNHCQQYSKQDTSSIANTKKQYSYTESSIESMYSTTCTVTTTSSRFDERSWFEYVEQQRYWLTDSIVV